MTVLRKGIDHDPVKPWNWATFGIEDEPCEIVSYPIPPSIDGGGQVTCQHDTSDCRCTIMVRSKVGDPTSIREVRLRLIAAFEPSRHEWILRERVYYGDSGTAFFFKDELPGKGETQH